MPPTNGPGFCKYVAGVGANVLFDPKAAEALKASAKTEGLASTEDASGKCLYTNIVYFLICKFGTSADKYEQQDRGASIVSSRCARRYY